MEVYGLIYLLIDGTNDKEYVGQTTRSVKARFKRHTKDDTFVGRVIRAHGAENFVIDILKECASKEELDHWEKHFIKSRNTMAPNGYNLTEGGEGGSPCDEVRTKISVAGKGRKKSPEHRAKIGAGNRGKKQPPEAKAKLSAWHMGNSLTKEAKIKLSVRGRHETSYKNLIAEMDKHQLTYTALAKLLGITKAAVSAKMRGKKNFTKEQVSMLEEIFGKPAEYLLQRDND